MACNEIDLDNEAGRGPRLTREDLDAVHGIGWDGDLEDLRDDPVVVIDD